MNKKLWVPQPATRLYSAAGEPESVRDQFVKQYGEGSVEKAEISIVLDLLYLNGIIKPSEFMDLMFKRLHQIDEMRRAAAGLESDRG